jgi:magnesium transporter
MIARTPRALAVPRIACAHRTGGAGTTLARRGSVTTKRRDAVERHVVTRIAAVPPETRASETLVRLAGMQLDFAGVIWVVDDAHRFVGAVRLEDVVGAPPDTTLGEMADPTWPVTTIHFDQEHVASDALVGRAVAVAVIDDDGRLIGAIPPLAILDVLRH